LDYITHKPMLLTYLHPVIVTGCLFCCLDGIQGIKFSLENL